MTRRGAPVRRSAAEWGIRGALAVTAAILGYAGVTRSAGYAMRTGDPARAHGLAPGDGRVTALYAQAVSRADATPAGRDRADRLAREALRQDPTAVAAVSTLGVDTQVRGDVAAARRLFTYAGKLSRRDLQTQVWGIEDAVGRGDVAGALRHYDVALRTSRDASGLLFPVLASAIADSSVRAALVGTLARRPDWGPHFIGYAAGEGAEPQATTRLFADLHRVGVPVGNAADVALVDRLIGNDSPDAAWAYYASTRPGTDRRMSRDPAFAGDPATGSRFDWRLVDTPGVSASILPGSAGGTFDFSAAPSTGGPLLEQMQALPPGRYRLDGHAAGIDRPADSRPYWSLTCRDGRELGRVPAPSSSGSSGAFAGAFVVPGDCPVQTLSLMVRPSDAMTGVAGQIGAVRLSPVDRK